MTDRDDTLIIVTADHAHTMSIAGYPERGNPITGLNGQLSDVGMCELCDKIYNRISESKFPFSR